MRPFCARIGSGGQSLPDSHLLRVEDREGAPVLLFQSEWNLNWVAQKQPDLVLAETAHAELFEQG